MQSLSTFAVLFALAVAPVAEAGLRSSRQPQQLAASGAAAQANPEVDAWHDAEKAKIEAECDEMMKKLWATKRQKLQDIVDALRRQIDDAKAAVAAAEAALADEMAELKKKKDGLKDYKPIDLGPYKDAVKDQEDKIAALEKKIAELEACVDELRRAQAELEEALRKLAEAERKLAAAKDAHADQVHDADVEASHVPPAQSDVEAAEDDLARAKARVAAAEKRLAKAKADLQEHDDGPHPALTVDQAAPVSEPAATPAHKSDARRSTAVVGAVGALMLAALVY